MNLDFLELFAVLGRVNLGSTEYTGMPDTAHIPFMMGGLRVCSYLQHFFAFDRACRGRGSTLTDTCQPGCREYAVGPWRVGVASGAGAGRWRRGASNW
jgi:hypothetical protein